MYFKYLIVIFLSSFCVISALKGFCPGWKYVRKTRIVWKTGTRQAGKNWFGRPRYESYQYPENEAYYDYVYTLDNCCNGFEKKFGNCVPICSSCPAHSYCSAPNTCSCDIGFGRMIYDKNLNSKCEPFCSKPCSEFSTCTAPDVCTCNDGYTLNAENKCSPICTAGCPDNSYCASPDKCSCNEGFEINNNRTICQPICASGCPLHSNCIAPNKCECIEGYNQSAHNFCEPICDIECTENSFCQAPNECKCLESYMRDAITDKCLPICYKDCPAFSSCTRPDVCECDNGYNMNEDESLCMPKCVENCPDHSSCVKPNECVCEQGYQLRNTSDIVVHCEPLCDEDCSDYGKCAAPNVCECFSGFEIQTDNPLEPLCKPKCSNNCTHGFCFAPETCVCNPGYLMGPNNSCVPVCSLSCVNSDCIEPEICACKAGYHFAANSFNVCNAICEPACINADCVEPNICICQEGYEPNEISMNVTTGTLNECLPACNNLCINGYCSAPNTCTCNEGYIKTSTESNECAPICERCTYGSCATPNVCICNADADYNINEEESLEICQPKTTALQTSDTFDTSTIETTTENNMESENTELYIGYTWNGRTEVIDASTESQLIFSEKDEDINNEIPSAQVKILHFSQCQTNCLCWQDSKELNSIKTNCISACGKGVTTKCVDPEDCECRDNSTEVICVAFDNTRLELQEFRYTCIMQKIEGNRKLLYIVIACSTVTGLLLIGAIAIIYLKRQNLSNTRKELLSVNFKT